MSISFYNFQILQTLLEFFNGNYMLFRSLVIEIQMYGKSYSFLFTQ